LAAQAAGVPFFVAAPTSTIDPRARSGADIPIEERTPAEVTHLGGTRVAAEGVQVFNPAFDVTPAGLIAAVVTERGVARAPYETSLSALLEA
jgi:methylthioribose-1-phosphate isomerase